MNHHESSQLPSTQVHVSEIPRRTTPTWEMELLLSGALVFSLLQLPTLIDTLQMRLLPMFSFGVSTATLIVGLYLRAGLLALCFAFIAHLAVRAYWVALIGINSVFPGKPDWSKSWNSPIGKRVASQTWIPLEERIEAADNVASVIFALGIACVVMMLSLSVVISVMIAFGMALTALSGGRISSFAGFLIGCAIPMALALIGPTIDQIAGKRLKEDSWLARAIAKSYFWQINAPGFAHMGAITSPIFLNVKLKTLSKFLIALPVLAILIASVMSSVQNISNRSRFEHFLPVDSTAETLRPGHYRNQRRGQARYQNNATIESMELGDKALLLFVPLSVDRHGRRILSTCPQLKALPSTERGSEAHLRCTAELLAPQLDGKAMDASSATWMLDGHSGFEGLAWRVDNALIAPGKHVLRIKSFNRGNTKHTLADQVITFYR